MFQYFEFYCKISSAKKKSKAIKEDMKKPYKEALQRKFFGYTQDKKTCLELKPTPEYYPDFSDWSSGAMPPGAA